MKITVSEKLLCDIFDFYLAIDKDIGDIVFGCPRSTKEAFCPELIRFRRTFGRKDMKRRFSKLLYRLKRIGYVRSKEIDGKEAILITSKGAERILKIKMATGNKSRRKDGKWVMVVFDIPEKRRRVRDAFREFLQLLDFRMFQKSIWVCPYDVLERVQQLVQRFFLEKSVRIFLVQEVEIS